MTHSFGDPPGRPLDTNGADKPPSQRPRISGFPFGDLTPVAVNNDVHPFVGTPAPTTSTALPVPAPSSGGFSFAAACPSTTPSSSGGFSYNLARTSSPSPWSSGGHSFATNTMPLPLSYSSSPTSNCYRFYTTTTNPPSFGTPAPVSSNAVNRGPGVDMSCLFNRSEESDVTLVVEGQEIPAHKIVLLASKSSLYHMCRDSNRVEIPDISHEDFLNKILYFVYTGHLQEASLAVLDDWFKILKKADEFRLDGLKDLAEHEITRFITVDNVMEVLRASVSYNAPRLQKHVSALIANALSSPGTGSDTPVHNGIRSLLPGDEDGKMIAAVLIACMTPL